MPQTLSLLPSGALPPLALVLRLLAAGVGRELTLDTLPQLNAGLPDVLALARIPALACAALPVPACRWAGARAAIPTYRPGNLADRQLHRGQIPIGEALLADDSPLLSWCDVARLQDASACLHAGDGAMWKPILAAAAAGRTQRLPPMCTRQEDPNASAGAWNPLAQARTALVTLPVGSRPWTLRASDGSLHPAQVVEGPSGPELVVALPLGALECTKLSEHAEPVAGPAWEVGPTVLDNGRVRAEFDVQGHLVRLCVDGVFAEPLGPLAAAMHEGLPLEGTMRVDVVESGPVRARLAMTLTAAEGLLRTTWTLHAQENCLRVQVVWSGEGTVWIEHPTAHHGVELVVAGELPPVRLAQAASVTEPGAGPIAGVRYAWLADPGGRGLAVAAARGQTVEARDGLLRVVATPLATYALTIPDATGATGLAALAQHLATPMRSFTGDEPAAPRLRLVGEGLVPLWIHRPPDWAGELLLVDHGLTRGRSVLYLSGGPPVEAYAVDVTGEPLDRLALTPEGDGVVIDHLAGDIRLVRWR